MAGEGGGRVENNACEHVAEAGDCPGPPSAPEPGVVGAEAESMNTAGTQPSLPQVPPAIWPRLNRAMSRAHGGEPSCKTHLCGFCREGNASYTYDLITTIRL